MYVFMKLTVKLDISAAEGPGHAPHLRRRLSLCLLCSGCSNTTPWAYSSYYAVVGSFSEL